MPIFPAYFLHLIFYTLLGISGAFTENLLIQDAKLFHSSAVYAAAINSITLPFRMEISGPSVTSQAGGVGSSDLETSLRLIWCSSARRVALAFPAPGVPGSS